MTKPSDDDLQAGSRAAVEAFVLRARRVGRNSLARDREALEKLCKPSWQMTFTEGERLAKVTRTLPPEEALESLAARVRPLILQDDPVHYSKALKALGYLLKDVEGAAEAHEYIKRLRQRWKSINSLSDEVRAYRVEVGPSDRSTPPEVMSDNSLAFAWFYGDVVHADAARRESAAAFDIVTRYEAAVHVIATVAWLAYATLHFIEQLVADGLLTLDEEAFSEPVTVEVTEITNEAEIFVGPEGADPPLPGATLGPEWVALTEADSRTRTATSSPASAPSDADEGGVDELGKS